MTTLHAKIRRVALIAGLFAVCAFAALYRGLDHPVMYNPGATPGELFDSDLRWSAQTILDMNGNADHETYLKMASDLLETGGFLRYHISIWPPGMPLVIAAVLTVSGGDYYFVKLILMTCLTWAIVLVALATLCPIHRSEILSVLAYSSILLLPVMRNWTFGYGSVMAEGIGCAIFVASLGTLVHGLRTRERRWFIITGVLLGAATYFRVYFRFAAEGLLAVSAAMILVPMLWKHLRAGLSPREIWDRLRPGPSDAEASRTWMDKRIVHYLLLAWVVSMLSLEPLRMYKLATIRTRSLYVMSIKDRMAHLWEADHEVPGYIHGANPACRVAPDLCEIIRANKAAIPNEEFKNLTFMTFFTHPFGWTWFKLSEADWLWFGRDWEELVDRPLLIVEGLLLLSMGLGGFIWLLLLYRRTRAPEYFLIGVVVASFCLINAGLFSFFHYEWRYSQPLRLFAFFLPLFVWSCRVGSPAARSRAA